MPQLLHQHKAVQPRQHHIQDRQVIGIALQQLKGLHAVMAEDRLIVGHLQRHRDQFRDGPVILHNQNGVRHEEALLCSLKQL